jgi:hypothetical protein
VTVHGILAEAGRLYVRFFWRSLLVAAAMFVVLTIPGALLDIQHDTMWTIMIASLFVTVFTAYGDFLLEGTLAVDLRDHEAAGMVPRLRTLARRTRPHFWTLLGATFVYSIGMAIGLLLLVVPGLFVLVRWSVIVPVIVLESAGMLQSFRRSNALVRGRGWTIFVVLLILFVISALLETGFDNLLYSLPEFFSSWLGHFVVSVLTAPFVAHALAVIYRRLVDLQPVRSS